MVQQVLQRFGFTYSSPLSTPLPTGHSLSAPPSDESVEPSGSYPKLVGCLITSGMGLVLGGRARVVLTGHADASWVDDLATQRSSQGYTFSIGSGSVSWRSSRSSSVLSTCCEAEIYGGAMAAEELRWLTYLLTDLGEAPRSPPVLYVDNKAMLALCQEHRLEHRTKHIALRYFLARKLQQRGHLRTYVDAVPPSGANIVDGMWIFRVKRPLDSLPAFKARYVARGFSQRQRVYYFQTFSPTLKMNTLWVLLHIAAQCDYELHSLDFSTTFLQDSLHEEIWLRRPPGFTGSFLAGTQWSLWLPVYSLRQAPREWHDTVRTTFAALGFTPSIADPSLFLRTDTSLPPFYILIYVKDLVSATADTEALTLVKSELQKRHTCTDLGELRSYLGLQITRDRARRTITVTQSHMVHQVLQRFGRTQVYYLCSMSGMGLVLGGRGPVVLAGHAVASWVDDLAMQRSSQGYTFSLGSGSVSWQSSRSSSVLSSSCESEIYTRAMAAQELRWLTYLLTDLGEQPRSPPVMYVDNKAMIALCQEHRLEHQTKHIAVRYFLARELQQRGQLRLTYVATRANIADIFTKALQSCNHQCFSIVLGLGPTLPHSLTT
ncbi:unnamed protein product [Closterium sp. NIES-54]